ncbi:Pectin acetylesterase 11 [Linum grandiflorum]
MGSSEVAQQQEMNMRTVAKEEEEDQSTRDPNNWLPITASIEAKWWSLPWLVPVFLAYLSPCLDSDEVAQEQEMNMLTVAKEEEDQSTRDLNNWHPITASIEAKWWSLPWLVPVFLAHLSPCPISDVGLDGSPRADHMEKGSGSGINNWVVHIEGGGGGWCADTKSCVSRRDTYKGSSSKMDKTIGCSENMLKRWKDKEELHEEIEVSEEFRMLTGTHPVDIFSVLFLIVVLLIVVLLISVSVFWHAFMVLRLSLCLEESSTIGSHAAAYPELGNRNEQKQFKIYNSVF